VRDIGYNGYMDFLEHVRAQSADKKTHFAVFVATCITGIIALVWISTLPAQIEQITQQGIPVAENEDMKTFSDVIEETGGNVASLEEVTDTLKDIPEQLEVVTQNLNKLNLEETMHEQDTFGNALVASLVVTSSTASTTEPMHAPSAPPKAILIEAKKSPSSIIHIGTSSIENMTH
jgi:hypothetical protein